MQAWRRSPLSERPVDMWMVILLICSNVFMNLAWYGHLKWFERPEWKFSVMAVMILASWGLAFFEYCLQVPANRLGFDQGYSTYQLKVIQEAISLLVFMGVAWFLHGEGFKWNYLVSFALIVAAVCFAVFPAAKSVN
jgi:uncharacterized protein (DUF486 family)